MILWSMDVKEIGYKAILVIHMSAIGKEFGHLSDVREDSCQVFPKRDYM